MSAPAMIALAPTLALLAGAASALAYGWRRRWIDALLALAAALALAAVAGAGDFALPASAPRKVALDAATSAGEAGGASVLTLTGDGLRAAQWHDLPARPLEWKAPATAVLRLDFPRRLALGRMFTLAVRRTEAGPARLQLLAENDQVIAESAGAGRELSVDWLPPAAEALVLKARVLDAAGRVLAQGPVPLIVAEAAPLRVQGRFGAPSFDARVLNELLAASGALLDWQVTLGKTVTRSEAPRAPMAQPEMLVIDAAWFERLHAGARAALLARVAEGTPLIVLAASASDTATWSRSVGLELVSQPEGKKAGTALALAAAPLNPAAATGGPWIDAGAMLWTRPWGKSRIAWLGVSDWHRHAISEPRALALWWQTVLDRVGVRRSADVAWLDPEQMPLPGQRLEVCAQGVRGEAVFPELQQSLAWQRRPDKADASCVAVWPRQPGWLALQAQGAGAQAHQVYVFGENDWPLWQAAERRAATARYAARTPAAPAGAGGNTAALPAWPFAVLFTLAMLALWWRERRRS